MARYGSCGRFQLLERLSDGGVASVYLAHPRGVRDLRHLYAVKWAHPHVALDRNLAMSLVDETRIVRSLVHPHICRVHGYGVEQGRHFIVMEYIHGKDLRAVQTRARELGEMLPYSLSAWIMAKVADALDYAHHRGEELGTPLRIIHRDINPHNVMLTYGGTPKVIDFGIAKAKGRVVETHVGQVKGKSSYMAPEQARGQQLDALVDIFAAGIVLYELTCDRLPYQGRTEDEQLQAAAMCRFEPPRRVNRDLPPELAAVIEKAMQHDPSRRYQRGWELRNDLERVIADLWPGTNAQSMAAYMQRLFHGARVQDEMHFTQLLGL